jgi:hypothetical protein
MFSITGAPVKFLRMKNPALKYGLLGAVVIIFYFLLLYASNKEHFLSPLLQWGSMVFYVFFMYRAAMEDCAANGTTRDFREILRAPFVVFLLINLGYWLFYYGLHLADPGMVQTEMGIELAGLKAQLSAGLGDPEQANRFRERIQDLEKTMQNPGVQPLGPIITRMFIGALGGFGLAAGIAAMLRSK